MAKSTMQRTMDFFVETEYAKKTGIQKRTFNRVIMSDGTNVQVVGAGEYTVPKNYKQFRIRRKVMKGAFFVCIIDLERNASWLLPATDFKRMSELTAKDCYSLGIMNPGLAADNFREDRRNYYTWEQLDSYRMDNAGTVVDISSPAAVVSKAILARESKEAQELLISLSDIEGFMRHSKRILDESPLAEDHFFRDMVSMTEKTAKQLALATEAKMHKYNRELAKLNTVEV